MKKIYSLLLAATAAIGLSAQTSIAISGNTVKFTTHFPTDGFNSTPVNIYSWISNGDSTAGAFKEAFGNWPGKPMTGPDANGNYTASIDLSTLYPTGTKVNEMNFIYNGNGGQTANLKASANATGWSPVTIATLAVGDASAQKSKSQVAAGKLFTSVKGNLELTVYDFAGKVVKDLKVNATGNPIELNLNQKGLYLVKITSGNTSEVVKFAY